MSDVKCPHCKTEQEINHDDGYGYGEDETYEQSCNSCDKNFGFTTGVIFCYEVFCADDKHEMEQSEPPHSDLWSCENCDYYEVRR